MQRLAGMRRERAVTGRTARPLGDFGKMVEAAVAGRAHGYTVRAGNPRQKFNVS